MCGGGRGGGGGEPHVRQLLYCTRLQQKTLITAMIGGKGAPRLVLGGCKREEHCACGVVHWKERDNTSWASHM